MKTTKKLTKKQQLEQEKQEALKDLQELLKDTKTIYTQLRQVSRSGMSRRISMYIAKDDKIICLDWYYLKASGGIKALGTLGSLNAWENGVHVLGCGMDMGYHLVSTLSYMLTDNKNYRLFTHRWL